VSRARLGTRGEAVNWIVADVTTWEPEQSYDVWHDRAVCHFLTEPQDRAAYAACVLKRSVPAGMRSSELSRRTGRSVAAVCRSFA